MPRKTQEKNRNKALLKGLSGFHHGGGGIGGGPLRFPTGGVCFVGPPGVKNKRNAKCQIGSHLSHSFGKRNFQNHSST